MWIICQIPQKGLRCVLHYIRKVGANRDLVMCCLFYHGTRPEMAYIFNVTFNIIFYLRTFYCITLIYHDISRYNCVLGAKKHNSIVHLPSLKHIPNLLQLTATNHSTLNFLSSMSLYPVSKSLWCWRFNISVTTAA